MGALIVHSYNLANGMTCTGFDEDDAELPEEQVEGILNLP